MLHPLKNSVYRFNHELPPHLPLAVRSAGEYILTPDAPIERPQRKWFCEIFWSEKGCGEFELDKQQIQVTDCEIFFLLPGEMHSVRALSKPWKYHWFTLDHPQSPAWLEALGFTQRPLPAQHCPVDLFDDLRAAVKKGTMPGDREAAHHAHSILLAAMEGSLAPFAKMRRSWVGECRQRIDKGYTDPQLDVAAIAKGMQIHRATLFRAFLEAYGMTPSQYLQSRRLHHAMELLKQSDAPIKEVAVLVGMNDANYLGRLIRKVSGVPPQRFRENYRQGRMACF